MKRMPNTRELHLLDIENLLGRSRFRAADVVRFREFYLDRNHVADDAQLIIATSSRRGIVEAGLGWPGARCVFKCGHNGADLALLNVIKTEHVDGRFEKVIIASGDAIFTDVAKQMQELGVAVTVFAHARSVSKRLTHASELVRLFDTHDFSLVA